MRPEDKAALAEKNKAELAALIKEAYKGGSQDTNQGLRSHLLDSETFRNAVNKELYKFLCRIANMNPEAHFAHFGPNQIVTEDNLSWIIGIIAKNPKHQQACDKIVNTLNNGIDERYAHPCYLANQDLVHLIEACESLLLAKTSLKSGLSVQPLMNLYNSRLQAQQREKNPLEGVFKPVEAEDKENSVENKTAVKSSELVDKTQLTVAKEAAIERLDHYLERRQVGGLTLFPRWNNHNDRARAVKKMIAGADNIPAIEKILNNQLKILNTTRIGPQHKTPDGQRIWDTVEGKSKKTSPNSKHFKEALNEAKQQVEALKGQVPLSPSSNI